MFWGDILESSDLLYPKNSICFKNWHKKPPTVKVTVGGKKEVTSELLIPAKVPRFPS